MKKGMIWKKQKNGLLCFTSLRPLNFKERKFETNYRSLLKFLRVTPLKTVFGKQIHGRRIREAKNCGEKIPQAADGFVSYTPGCMLLIFTADCLPVFIYDTKKRYIALAHCGWKGVHKEIVKNAIRKLIKKGSKTADLRFILGPGIRECCYEVSPSFVRRFERRYGKTGIYTWRGLIYFSLPDILKEQLKIAKIPAKNIKDTKSCTCCQPEKYYSYRREGKRAGRMVSGIITDA